MNFEGQLSVGHAEVEVILLVLNPALIENREEVISGAENLAKAALPTEVPGIGIKLGQIVMREERGE